MDGDAARLGSGEAFADFCRRLERLGAQLAGEGFPDAPREQAHTNGAFGHPPSAEIHADRQQVPRHLRRWLCLRREASGIPSLALL